MWLYLLGFLAFLLLYRWYRQRQILGNLTEKYVFITGCDTGFGNLLARQLDKRGMCVLAACLTHSGAEHLKNVTSDRLETVILDVTDGQSVINAGLWVSEIVREKGLWGLVNNAGISGLVAPNGWLKKEDYLKPLYVNLMGTIEVTLTLLPLIRRARGRIVNVSSTLGRVALLAGGYTISKYGVEAFSDTLRREVVEFGIKVSIIEPGGFVTGITDMAVYSRELKDTWRSQTRETKKCYGKDYTEKYLNYMIRAFVASSSKTYLVTDCMEHALIARYPWTRYSAGWDAKLILIPLSYMPTFIVDFQARKRLPKAVQDDDEDY